MSKFNSVAISGNVVADSEQSGNGPTKLTVAWNKPKKPAQQGGEWTYEGHFFDVVLWDDSVSFRKGERVVVEGHIEQQRWETPEGDKRSKVVIIADSIGIRPSTTVNSPDPTEPQDTPAQEQAQDDPGW